MREVEGVWRGRESDEGRQNGGEREGGRLKGRGGESKIERKGKGYIYIYI